MSTPLRTAVMRIMSEMLDDPEMPPAPPSDLPEGIYPTGRFMDRIEALLDSMMAAPEVMQLSGSEALFGFAAWLTTSDEFEQALRNPPYGPTQDAAPWADMVGRFCKINHLSDPREEWSELLTHPESPDG